MAHPMQRFLGVEEDSDAQTLLGLPADVTSLPQIDAALRKQLARVHRHPDGKSSDGDVVKRRLRQAAEQLKLQYIRARRQSDSSLPPSSEPKASQHVAPRQPPGPRVQPKQATPRAARPERRPVARHSRGPTLRLTEFDRAVLAVLVGCGGWNAECRTRLVALSSIYGVSVQGLMRVITGLSNYARAGGQRLGVAEIAGSDSRVSAPAATVVPDSVDETTDLLSRLLPEFQEDSLWSRMKLIALFSVITLIAGALVLRVLLSDPGPRRAVMQPGEPGIVETVEQPNASELVRQQRSQPQNAMTGPAQFVDAPTFLGSGVPMDAVNAADECPSLPAELDSVARRLTVGGDPSQALLRDWQVSIETIAQGWLLTDDPTRQSIRSMMFDALFAASTQPNVSDRLLADLTPPSGALADPIDVVRGSYRAGALGEIAGANLPPVVTDRSRGMLEIALGAPIDSELTTFDGAARRWLLRALPNLIERASYDGRAFDYWELWIATVRRIATDSTGAQDHAQLDDAYLRAIIAVLTTGPELTTDNPAARIVGRLAQLIDIERSPTVRDSVLTMFANEQISSQDLWVLTSILLEFRDQSWMSNDLALPPDADAPHRRRIVARWRSQWPEPSRQPVRPGAPNGARLVVDAELYDTWRGHLETLAAAPRDGTTIEQLNHVIALSRLNEAAGAMYRQDAVTAQEILDDVTDALIETTSTSNDAAPQSSQPPPSPIRIRRPNHSPLTTPIRRGANQSPRPRPGQPIGFDGEWATLYEQAARNTSEKLNLLSALRNSAGTDLGPIDAGVFVGVVFRGSPQEVRALAQSVLVDQFATGPRVAMELLDQSIHAPTSRELSDTIAQLAGRLLPPVRAPSWTIEFRRALLGHAMLLQPNVPITIDQAEIVLAESMDARSTQIARNATGGAATAGPMLAVQSLREAWQQTASVMISMAPTPDDLPGLARRHDVRLSLARGPIQEFVAHQIAVAELLAFVTTAERPHHRDVVLELLDSSAQWRQGADSVLLQSIEIEHLTARLWQLRMGAAAEQVDSGHDPS